MKDPKGEADFLQPPDDIETLFTWANLYGSKYRDFSKSRQQVRDDAQQHEKAQAESPEVTYAQKVTVPSTKVVPGATPTLATPTPAPVLPVPSATRTQGVTTKAAIDEIPLASVPSEPSVTKWGCVAETVSPVRVQKATSLVAASIAPSAEAPVEWEDSSPRWNALKNILNTQGQISNVFLNPQVEKSLPILAVFSLAGGVGKTSLLATLGRALTACGESVLLVDTAAYGLLPFYFGAHDQRLGVVRTFASSESQNQSPVRVVTLAPEDLICEDDSGRDLAEKLRCHAPDATRILIDVATASNTVTKNLIRLAPTVLVPVIPDMSSVMTLGAVEFFFQRYKSAEGKVVKPYYILNQFDEDLPLHRDIRDVLSHQLGDRLLPFAFRRSSAVSEALAEGLTVFDYAPGTTATEDVLKLVHWLQTISPSVTIDRLASSRSHS